MSNTDIGDRLAMVRGDMSQAKFAASIGVHKSTYAHYERGETAPDARTVVRICNSYKVSYRWLLSGQGPMRIADLTEEDILADQGGFEYVGKRAAQLSSGDGGLEVREDVRGYYAFRKDWLATKGSRDDMVLLDVAGDSMLPTLCNGDTVLVDLSQTRIVPGRIYAVAIDEAVLIKRMDVIPGKIILVSDNPKYQRIEIPTKKAHGFRVLGRVVWLSRDL